MFAPTTIIDNNIPVLPPTATGMSLKILCLHGYTQSGPSFEAKTGVLQRAVEAAIPNSAFYFPSGPHRLDVRGKPGLEETYTELQPSMDGDIESFAWANPSNDLTSGKYIGVDKSLIALNDYLERFGPFDGVVGFSQGACVAALLASLLEPGRERPDGFNTKHEPFKFAILYSGMRAPLAYEELYSPKITTPTLHFIGDLDVVIDPKLSMQLVEACERPSTITLHGSHQVARKPVFVQKAIEFIKECVSATPPPPRPMTPNDVAKVGTVLHCPGIGYTISYSKNIGLASLPQHSLFGRTIRYDSNDRVASDSAFRQQPIIKRNSSNSSFADGVRKCSGLGGSNSYLSDDDGPARSPAYGHFLIPKSLSSVASSPSNRSSHPRLVRHVKKSGSRAIIFRPTSF